MNSECYTRGDDVPGIKVDGMDSMTAWARSYALKNGPLFLEDDDTPLLLPLDKRSGNDVSEARRHQDGARDP